MDVRFLLVGLLYLEAFFLVLPLEDALLLCYLILDLENIALCFFNQSVSLLGFVFGDEVRVVDHQHQFLPFRLVGLIRGC